MVPHLDDQLVNNLGSYESGEQKPAVTGDAQLDSGALDALLADMFSLASPLPPICRYCGTTAEVEDDCCRSCFAEYDHGEDERRYQHGT